MVKGNGVAAAMAERSWPRSLTEVPYWVFQDEDVYEAVYEYGM